MKSPKGARVKGEAVADRLYMDAEARRIREQKRRKEQEKIIDSKNKQNRTKATPSARGTATQEPRKKTARGTKHATEPSSRTPVQPGSEPYNPSSHDTDNI